MRTAEVWAVPPRASQRTSWLSAWSVPPLVVPEPPHRIDGDSQSEDDEEEEKDEPKVVHAEDAQHLWAAGCHLTGKDEREREKDRRATDVDGREDAAVARREHEQRRDGRDERQDPEECLSHGSSPQ